MGAHLQEWNSEWLDVKFANTCALVAVYLQYITELVRQFSVANEENAGGIK